MRIYVSVFDAGYEFAFFGIRRRSCKYVFARMNDMTFAVAFVG